MKQICIESDFENATARSFPISPGYRKLNVCHARSVTDSLMSSQMPDNSMRYPQSTEPGHYQHISQPQGIKLFDRE